MKRNRIRILIVDDDATQGKAIQELLTRAGYQASWYQTSVQGLTATQREDFQCLIIDCMLPKMNGMDLVEEIQNISHQKPKTFMYSGVFRDKGFIKETLEKTKALNFFVKPLNLDELLKAVDCAFANELSNNDPPLLPLYGPDKLDDRELVELIKKEPAIPTFHLPMLYRRIQQSKLTGELTIVDSENDPSTICIHQGQVFSVRTSDKSSFFGAIAVDFGFVSPEQVMAALNSTDKKLLGQKLTDSMALSPQKVQVILGEQLALRLSQTVRNGVVSVQWAEQKFPPPEYTLNPLRFEGLINEWSTSKLDPQWMKANLLLWGAYSLSGDFHNRLNNLGTLENLIHHPDFNDQTDLPYLFRQLMNGFAIIGSKSENRQNFQFFEQRLNALLDSYKNQNCFQILGVREKAHPAEVIRAFEDLKEFFDPAKLAPNCPPALLMKCTQVFQIIEDAYQTLVDDIKKQAYIMGLQRLRQQEIMAHEPQFRAAVMMLRSGNAAGAAKKFQELLDKKIDFRELRSYRLWAGLKMDRQYKGLNLEAVPPEERHSAPYMMAVALSHKNRGQYQKAFEAFSKAHILDPSMAIAKLELEALKKELKKQEVGSPILKEISSAIENLLGKIKRGA